MLTKWSERKQAAEREAARGKGVPIPYSGRNRYKPGPKWIDEIGDNWRRWWRRRSLAKINNRDKRAAEGREC